MPISGHPLFCVCLECSVAVARSHRDADAACGRDWLCTCGACEQARRLADLPAHIARIEAMERQRTRIPFADDLPGTPFLVDVERSAASLEPPDGCRLERWEYPEGTPRLGVICATCGAALDPGENHLSAIRQEHLETARAAHVCPAQPAARLQYLGRIRVDRRKLH